MKQIIHTLKSMLSSSMKEVTGAKSKDISVALSSKSLFIAYMAQALSVKMGGGHGYLTSTLL